MSHRQKFIYTRINPLAFGNALAFGTMAVAAGIIGCFNMIAGVTYIHMETVFCGAAMLNSIHDIELICRELVVSAIFLSVKIENIGNFVFWLILR